MDKPLVKGSTHKFRLTATKAGVAWNITGALVRIGFKLPDNRVITKVAEITNAIGGIAEYDSILNDINIVGMWSFSWEIVQGNITQESLPESFRVIAGIIK